MGFFKKPKHCVFSAVSGHLTLNGEPVKNARLVRTGQLGHAESQVTDEAITDENGYFEFPDMYQSASEFGGVASFVIFQNIGVYREVGDPEEIWRGVKRDGAVGHESRGNPWVLNCDLLNEERMYLVNGNRFHTVCRWDIEEDVVEQVREGR